MQILTNEKYLNTLRQVLKGVETTADPYNVASPVALLWDVDAENFLNLLQKMNAPPDFIILACDEHGLRPVDFETIEPAQMRMERTEDLLDDPFAVNAPGDVYDAFCNIVRSKMDANQEKEKMKLARIKQIIERFIGLEIPDEKLLLSAVASQAGVTKDEALLALSEYTTINKSRVLEWRQDV